MCTLLLLAQSMCSRQIEVCTKAFQGLSYLHHEGQCVRYPVQDPLADLYSGEE